MAPKARTKKDLPKGIKPDKLPNRVFYNSRGNGRWMISYYENGKRKHKMLATSSATMNEIYQLAAEQENSEKKATATFLTLVNEFQQSRVWRELSKSTQIDYRHCIKAIASSPTADGILGDEPIKLWTIGLVRRLQEKRAETSKSRAIKELAFLKRFFGWLVEFEYVKEDVAKPVKKLTLPPRQHYADDNDYRHMLQTARESGYWYIEYAMELAYLCRMRVIEVLDLTDANELENGLKVSRRKGSRTNVTTWQPRLRAAWYGLKNKRDAILAERKQPLPIDIKKRFLFISERTGNKLSESAMQTAWQRVRELAVADAAEKGIPFTPFNIHDLKRKGITDTDGTLSEKMDASGHRSAEMMNIYDVGTKEVAPTRD